MEDTTSPVLEELLSGKILLYNDLLRCFMKERESLINIDLDKLWSISKEKEEICAEIRSVNRELMAQIDPDMNEEYLNFSEIIRLIPQEEKGKFQGFRRTLMTLESEIEALKKENMMYIDDSLRFLDDMISIITGEGKARIVYNDRCHLQKSGTNTILSREA